jgi:hypothetical protein
LWNEEKRESGNFAVRAAAEWASATAKEKRHTGYACPLRFEDFLSAFDDKETVVQSITPLQAVELRPRDRLLVVTCDYQLADKSKAGAVLEDRFVLAAESAGFNLNTALLPQGTAAS